MRISIRIVLVFVGFLLLQMNGFAQSKSSDGFYYDTLAIMDNNTYEESIRLSQMRKPITRNFYLKSETLSYSLFKGKSERLTADQVLEILEDGMSLYIDKMEHQGHKNLKPSVMELMDGNGEVIESFELNEMKDKMLNSKLVKDALIRFSGFAISVNQKKNGPIILDVQIVE